LYELKVSRACYLSCEPPYRVRAPDKVKALHTNIDESWATREKGRWRKTLHIFVSDLRGGSEWCWADESG